MSYSRSQNRGLRGGRGFYTRGSSQPWFKSRFTTRPATPPPEPIPNDLGTFVEAISSNDVQPTSSGNTTIQNAEAVASFNWVGSVDTPTIVIPGAPPRWAPPHDKPRLQQDDGEYYRDINAAFSPQSPMHATALAILASPKIPRASIDLVACASTFRSLFEFVRGERKTFRVMVRDVHDTIFFTRREASSRATIPDVRGYGHSMPEAYTMWDADVKGSLTHQRVLRYHFAGMDCLMRYECDGYFPDEHPAELSPLEAGNYATELAIDEMVNGVSLAPKSPLHTSGSIEVKNGGMLVPQCATFELKTRTIKRMDEDFFAEFAIRLWLTQTPHFLVGFHRAGVFDEIRISDVRSKVTAWQSENQDNIKRFAGLIEIILERIRSEPSGMLELWRHETGDLEFRVPLEENLCALPEEVEERWTDASDRGVSV